MLDYLTNSKIVYRQSIMGYIRDFLLRRMLFKLGKSNAKKGYPKLLCLPNDFIGQRIIVNGLYEEKLLLSLFEKIFINTESKFINSLAIDVGANIGNHSCFFSSYFKKVIAFEPNPNAVKILEANLFLNKISNVVIYPVGLSNVSSYMPFYDGFTGNLGASHFTNKLSKNTPTTELLVKIGDEVIEKHYESESIALIKIDVEGFEFAVLQGLSRTIQKHKPFILFEVLTGHCDLGQQSVFNLLLDYNYKYFYSIEFPFNRSKSFMGKLCYRVIHQPNYYITEIKKIENRPYSLVLGSSRPIDLNQI